MSHLLFSLCNLTNDMFCFGFFCLKFVLFFPSWHLFMSTLANPTAMGNMNGCHCDANPHQQKAYKCSEAEKISK